MPLFRKKADPISQRARALNAEIAELEQQIRKLNAALENQDPALAPPTAGPSAKTAGAPFSGRSFNSPTAVREPAPRKPETIFEEVDHRRFEKDQPSASPTQFNHLGVRKYDLLAAWQRFTNHFRTKPVANPKLVSYLAAGSIQGLRPLRYEKRVARNRVLFLTAVFVLMLLGIILVLLRR
jgi:hypothetical protein